MYAKLATDELKTGEPMEVGMVLCPDDDWAQRIIPFLWHKGGAWNAHTAGALNGEIRDLETRFYLGIVDGRLICNVMTVEWRGVGILGHVFTVPDQRRKGACNLVMARQMEEFRQRGGRCLYLGTGYDTHPYHIYRGFGFGDAAPESGFMVYTTIPEFHQQHFAPADCAARDAQWRDWPAANVLTAIKDGPVVRNVGYGAFGIANFEGAFCTLRADLESGHCCWAKVLETKANALVGLATLVPDGRWGGGSYLFDLFVHRSFVGEAHLLTETLEFPAGKVQSHIDAEGDARGALLETLGFEREATLRSQLRLGDARHDVAAYARLAT
ncbi:MAG: hypothetical protein COY42_17670 [Armatimonadetes bacterium CG_4_10_14_0_8_um_filter_66_14]|nr:GNAT family N-acetyltransferase [Armatimonadota bacterium]OIP05933.1 MAG: hypothetical protein AUJ96_09945 [Armatimonadetes bacterium CG2_30_66_41]PIZ42411.1 MAG: hypothetical protein COY42_17670 [Armatimonadetes bacterium CG_4_10_14_0_8_um_filter_66_14]NCO91473.1 GNAT family N-acetyltransferase [Armatimonadota bacterium]NCP32606.1 GNAT family N-acetyltransferase [Armatimonadota bacterium]